MSLIPSPLPLAKAAGVDLVDDRVTPPGALGVVDHRLSSFGCQGMT